MKIKPGVTKIIFDDGTFNQKIFEVEEKATLIYVLALHKGSFNKDITIKLLGEGAQSSFFGLYCGRKNDDFKIKTTTIHGCSKTFAQTLIKGVLEDQSQGFIQEIIGIEVGAKESTDTLSSKTLLLSKQARVICLPFLEINNNDVQASHSVAVSQIDPEEMFYLQARGIDLPSAQKLAIAAFLSEITTKIPTSVKTKVEGRLNL